MNQLYDLEMSSFEGTNVVGKVVDAMAKVSYHLRHQQDYLYNHENSSMRERELDFSNMKRILDVISARVTKEAGLTQPGTNSNIWTDLRKQDLSYFDVNKELIIFLLEEVNSLARQVNELKETLTELSKPIYMLNNERITKFEYLASIMDDDDHYETLDPTDTYEYEFQSDGPKATRELRHDHERIMKVLTLTQYQAFEIAEVLIIFENANIKTERINLDTPLPHLSIFVKSPVQNPSNQAQYDALLDTGSQINCISEELVKRLGLPSKSADYEILTVTENQKLEHKGTTVLAFEWIDADGKAQRASLQMFIFTDLAVPFILSSDFIRTRAGVWFVARYVPVPRGTIATLGLVGMSKKELAAEKARQEAIRKANEERERKRLEALRKSLGINSNGPTTSSSGSSSFSR